MFIDAVNEHADLAEDGDAQQEAATPHDEDPTMAAQAAPLPREGDTVEGLREQLATLEAEKLKMFEIMKALQEDVCTRSGCLHTCTEVFRVSIRTLTDYTLSRDDVTSIC